jgi:DNA-binding response OmpR family regulator
VKLILLEDDSLIQLCTQDALETAGFEVLPALRGEEALQVLSDTQDIRGMMVDVRLGCRLNGWEVARRAREEQPGLAIVYTTTADSNEFWDNAVPRSVLLQKPYTLDRAVEAMRDALAAIRPSAVGT